MELMDQETFEQVEANIERESKKYRQEVFSTKSTDNALNTSSILGGAIVICSVLSSATGVLSWMQYEREFSWQRSLLGVVTVLTIYGILCSIFDRNKTWSMFVSAIRGALLVIVVGVLILILISIMAFDGGLGF